MYLKENRIRRFDTKVIINIESFYPVLVHTVKLLFFSSSIVLESAFETYTNPLLLRYQNILDNPNLKNRSKIQKLKASFL